MTEPKPRVKYNLMHDLRPAVYNIIEREIEKQFVYKSCINCINFREHQNEICGLANQRPPARVIVFGCPKWEDKDEIPF